MYILAWAGAGASEPKPRRSSNGPQGSQPNLHVTGVKVTDSAGNTITPMAGEPFFVEVAWNYANPVCTDYTITRVVNGWTNTAPPIHWGCGYTGNTSWNHVWGAWVLYKAGVYSITATVDSGGAIAESDEGDNSLTVSVTVGGTVVPEWALVNAEFGRTSLGPGTDVIVGTMDDAFDYLHPWYQGNDSRGRPRHIASVQNALGYGGSPTNSGHSTAVMGIVLAQGANDGDLTGLAPDARYVSAEFINRENVPGLAVLDIRDAAGVMTSHGVDVINMSWSWWFGANAPSETGDAPISDLLADYLGYASNIVCVPAVNELANPTLPTAPGAARNGITVGGLEQDLLHAWRYDNFGPTLDGRSKPDLLGNSATNAVAPSGAWRSGFPAARGYDGNSFSAPFVTGAVAEMIGYAKRRGLNRDHRLIKAILLSSCRPALGDDGSAWSNSVTQPLDRRQGAGIFDLQRVYEVYSAGPAPAGAVGVPGFDVATIHGVTTPGAYGLGATNGVVKYRLGAPAGGAADLEVTLAWDRHTYWEDANTNGVIDAADSFYTLPGDAQDNLDLTLFRDGVVVAESRSTVDTIEHLHLTALPPGAYELQVERLDVPNSGDSEPYALAWHSTSAWNPLPPSVAITQAGLGAGNTAVVQVRLLGGQTGGLTLQASPDLASPGSWTTLTNAALSQTGATTFQLTAPLPPGSAAFLRVLAEP